MKPNRFFLIKYLIEVEGDHSGSLKNGVISTNKAKTAKEFFDRVAKPKIKDKEDDVIEMKLVESKEIDEETFDEIGGLVEPVMTDSDLP